MPTGAVNECIPYFEPGAQVTFQASAAVTGKKFVTISGNMQSDGTPTCGLPAAGGRVFGVAMYDVALGKRGGVWRRRGTILPVTSGGASGAMAANLEVQVDATGAVVPLAGGVAVGYLVDGTAGNGAVAKMSLY